MKDRDPKGQYMKIRLSSIVKSVIKISVMSRVSFERSAHKNCCAYAKTGQRNRDKSTQELKKCKEDPRR